MRRPVRGRPLLLAGVALALIGCKSPAAQDPAAQAEGFYLQGTERALRGDYPGALQAFAEVEKRAPGDPRLDCAIGDAELGRGNLLAAEQRFLAAVAKAPSHAAAFSRLGLVEARLGKWEQAGRALMRALELNPEDAHALEQLAEMAAAAGRVKEAVGYFLAAAKASIDPRDPAPYLRAAEVLGDAGQSGEAAVVLKKGIAAGVRGGEVSLKLAELQLRAGDLAAASASYRRAGDAEPRDPQALEMLGHLEVARGDLAAAEASFRAALGRIPTPSVLLALARLLFQQGDRGAAARQVEEALQLAAQGELDAALTEQLADALAMVGRPADALRLLQPLLQAPEGQAAAGLWRKAGRWAGQAGDKAMERTACARAVALDPKARCR